MNSKDQIERLKRRDRDAISDLYDRYSATFFGIILRIVKTKDKAESILENSFLKIIEDIPYFNNTSGLFSWMCRIVRSMAIKEIASQGVNPPLLSKEDEELISANNLCADAIADLEMPSREIFRLVFMEGQSVERACGTVNISIDQARFLIRGAFNHISRKINIQDLNNSPAYES